MSAERQVGRKKAVAIEYTLTIDDGIVVDASVDNEPLWYVHGFGTLVPGLERGLNGLHIGDEKRVVVPPEDGYGERKSARVHRVHRSRLPRGPLQLGERIDAQSPDGRVAAARISGLEGDEILLDFNHDLAGKTLTFDVKIVDIRRASKDEINAARGD